MKKNKIILMLLLLLIGTKGISQKKSDHELIMSKFQHYYKQNLADSLFSLFNNSRHIYPWTMRPLEEFKNKHGEIISIRYLLVSDEPLGLERRTGYTLYKVTTSKETIIVGFKLNKKNKFKYFQWNMPSKYKQSELFMQEV